MNTKHSEPFYISNNLFDNKRLKRRLCKWMERLREPQNLYMARMRIHTQTDIHAPALAPSVKTERSRRRRKLTLSRRHVAATLPADITIDLLSDDESNTINDSPNAAQAPEEMSSLALAASGLFLHARAPSSLQLSTIPNISLVPVPVKLVPAQSTTMLLMPASNAYKSFDSCKRVPSSRKRFGDVTSTTTHAPTISESIVLTSDDEDGKFEFIRRHKMRSPPPLAPLTFSDTIEEVTVSLVPRNSTTANCQARHRRRYPQESSFYSISNTCPNDIVSPKTNLNGYLRVDVASDAAASLPDETTVHTVIANRIYELSLSKLREGLASSGVPEYTQDLLPEHLQKLSPAMRAKVAPMVAPSPPAPISLKLSSDLSISLISDDDDCENGNASGSRNSDLLHPVVAAHAAAKLLKQQQPQLSVVQHLQYPGLGTPVALPVIALAATPPTLTTPSTRRRKLG